MNRFLLTTLFALAAFTGQAQASGFSVNVGQPGFYGRIDIGGMPPPALIYPQPMLIERVPVGRPPLYLRVPPGHARHWNKHCHSYRACGQPVYFVRDDWYRNEYAPRYQERYGERRRYDGDRYRDAYRRDDNRYEQWDRHGGDRDGGRGHGHGRGHDR